MIIGPVTRAVHFASIGEILQIVTSGVRRAAISAISTTVVTMNVAQKVARAANIVTR